MQQVLRKPEIRSSARQRLLHCLLIVSVTVLGATVHAALRSLTISTCVAAVFAEAPHWEGAFYATALELEAAEERTLSLPSRRTDYATRTTDAGSPCQWNCVGNQPSL